MPNINPLRACSAGVIISTVALKYIDAVLVAPPDPVHALASIMAMKMGKLLKPKMQCTRRESLRCHKLLQKTVLGGMLSACWMPFAPAAVKLVVADLHAQLPQFTVPGFEPEMKALNEMHALHHGGAFSDCTLWDAWLPLATLWTDEKARERYRAAFLNRRIDAEGYVATQQHRGLGHSDGWPFPTYQQSGGAGWHFSLADEAYAVGIFKQSAVLSTEGWEIVGAAVEGIDPACGLNLRATSDVVTVTTPAFRCGTVVAPFARIEWAARGLPVASQPYVCWQFEGEPGCNPERRMGFPALGDADGMRYANVPLCRHPGYGGVLTRYRFVFDKAAGARLTVKSVITAIDTRHPGNNADYTLGCADYFDWTCDTAFLKEVLPKLRRAMDFAIREFALREEKCVRVPWVGHDGRSGLGRDAAGMRVINLGLGVGNGYYDLVPFGGRDAYVTVHYYAALMRLAALEQAVERHPEWRVPVSGRTFSPDELRTFAAAMREHAGTLFWKSGVGRFAGWQDLAGRFYDYGFTFVNLEAIHYGLATPEQSRSIFEWLDGKRTIEGDTSTGADIYRWRFGARATTKRNIETYVWCWPKPEDIPWGGQVQDGGAVLGFSYFDLMARLKIYGPDDAWLRLREILAWFRDVQAEGGYRAYYAKPDRGTLQGGGPAGGLGMDQEFMESVLVPQVMLYGFLGFSPAGDTYTVKPRLPKEWPSLTVTDIHFRDQILDVTAHADGRVEVRSKTNAARD